jgi:hypothetical protein
LFAGLSGCTVPYLLGWEQPADAGSGLGCPALAGRWTLEAPVPVSEVNSSFDEMEPVLSPDQLTLFFSSRRDGSGLFHDFQATRPSIGAAFSGVVTNPWVPQQGGETRFSLSKDGLVAFLSASWPNGAGATDLWMASRATVGDSFGTFLDLNGLNTPDEEYDPVPSDDGTRLYFTRWFANSTSQLMVASHTAAGDTYANPVPVAGFDSTGQNTNAVLTPDETLVVFASYRDGGSGGADIWYASRPDVNSAFSNFQPLPVVNTSADDDEPLLSGCEFFFASGRGGSQDIFHSRIIPSP